MPKDTEFSISKSTFEKLQLLKKKMGFDEKGWDDLFNLLLNSNLVQEPHKNDLEKIFEKSHYKNYEEWDNLIFILCSNWSVRLQSRN